MSELLNLAKNENIDLEDCIVFSKGNGDYLAVNVKYIGIRQRQDKLMSVNFSMSPKQVIQLEEFFSTLNNGEMFFYNISQTGYIPVNYRGLSNVTKKASAIPESVFQVSLIMQPAQSIPKDNYFDPTCACCTLHHII